MTGTNADPFALLERAIGYALGNVQAVTCEQLPARTPCPDWDLGTLLRHVNESLALLCACLDRGVTPPAGAMRCAEATNPVDVFRARAARLISAFSRGACPDVVRAAGYPLAMRMIAATGAIEIAVHGWDVARTMCEYRPIPNGLARDLLWLCPLITADAEQHRLFAPPIPLPATADVSDRLVALLGRDPN
ncbi:MAG TPA: maleylpyruvate isomerase family mycothiol-dependent enzyme [Jatrophihabitantaceae bacterium]